MSPADPYADLPLQVRLHTRIRAWTCPIQAVVDRVPGRGRLLDVGCGHGVFAHGAARRHPDLDVLGIDPSPDKVRWAESSAGRGNLRFRSCRIEDLPDHGFDAVAILDVLYLVPRGQWSAFLEACRERLRPGGKLLLKEVAPRPRWKFYRCVLQELVSVRLLGITLGATFAFAGPEEMRGVLAGAGFEPTATTDLGAGYLSPHVLYEAVRR